MDPVALVLRPEERANDQQPGNFELIRGQTSERYRVEPAGEVYRRLALLPVDVAGTEIRQTIRGVSANGWLHRLVVVLESANGLWTDDKARDVVERFEQLFADAAADRAHRCAAHFVHDAAAGRLTLLWPDVVVEDNATLRAAQLWLVRGDPAAAPEHLQPHQTGVYLLPGVGTNRYSHSLKPGVPREELRRDTVFIELAPQIEAEAARRARCLRMAPSGDGGARLSAAFKRFKRQCFRPNGGGPAAIGAQLLENLGVHAQYLARLAANRSTCIDLSDASLVWDVSGSAQLMPTLIELIKEDQHSGFNDTDNFVFRRFTDYLNQLVAREIAPGTKVWIKRPTQDSREAGACVAEYPLNATLRLLKLPFLLPESEEERDRAFNSIKPIEKDGDTINLFEWFMRYGCREVHGLRFLPLRLGEQRTDRKHVGYINTFQGINAQRWVSTELERCEELYLEYMRSGPYHGDFGFLFDHIKNICCGSAEQADFRHGWNAHLCFWPDEKLPVWFINQGPPGCGKSLFEEKFAEFMLNKAHVRKVRDMRGLVGHFNADADGKLLTIIEEMDFKEAKKEALLALQELVSAVDVRGERKGIDAAMRRDFNHFVCNTNVESPVPLPLHQRRCVINRVDREFANKLYSDAEFRTEYVKRLARVLNDERVWRSYAFYLYEHFMLNDAAELRRFADELHTRRRFNFATTIEQLKGMLLNKETSVLGWLFRNLSMLTPLVPEAGSGFVLRWNATDADFTRWNSWAYLQAQSSLMPNDPEVKASLLFKNHDWSDPSNREVTARWWQKSRREALYKTYAGAFGRLATPLDEVEFFSELKRLLVECQPPESPLLFERSETRTRYGPDPADRTKQIPLGKVTDEWVCLAPLAELEAAVERMIPSGLDFTWEAYRAEAKKGAKK